MSKYTIGGFIVALLVIFALIFLFMNLEKNERTNRVTEENLKFITSTFDDTRSLTQKILDFDFFKYSRGYDVKAPIYTYTVSKKVPAPYTNVAATGAAPNEYLNNTLPTVTPAATSIGAPISEAQVVDTIPSLTGLNAGTEASIRESMVRSELRRVRR
jgi:hypothetical protein